ncbi:MAG: hemerythrin domain-containing protein [Parachlamydiales bacterium]|nr:hemerythrin domain-containing protein [Parachlamydiales bacterium]
MKTANVLFEEHATIQKMLKILEIINRNLSTNSLYLLDNVIDFFRTYTDKNHHGKEESILFEKLKDKPLKQEEKKILEELIDEHKQSRKMVIQLEDLKNQKNVDKIHKLIEKMLVLYKNHIEKENTKFFPPAFNYFSDEEKKEMFLNFLEVDKKVLNEKYLQVINDLEVLLKENNSKAI